VKREEIEFREKVVYEQMVVDNEDVCIVQLPVMAVIKTFLIKGAQLSTAVIRVSRDTAPEVRYKVEFVLISRSGRIAPLLKSFISLSCVSILFFPLQTEVVILTLE